MLFENASLKNKIFISCLGFILLLSIIIALFTRWLLISSLTDELKKRGVGISQSIADASRGYILTKNRAELTAIAFDAKQGNRKDIVLYLMIRDEKGLILAHTFTSMLPENLLLENRTKDGNPSDIKQVDFLSSTAFHVSVPIKEGIYTIGSVHVGLDKKHIARLISKLRFLFFSFLSAVAIVFFIMSHWLSRYITKPVSALTEYTDQITMGNYNILPEEELVRMGKRQVKGNDELKKLTDSFLKMTAGLRLSRIKLEESEEKYRSLFNSGPNPIFVIDQNSLEIIEANPRAIEIYGYTEGQLKGMHFSRLGSLGTDRLSRDEPFGADFIISSKVKFYTKESDSLYVNLHTNPAKYKGRDALIVATADITELVEKDSQLIQASKMTNLEKMSAGIAHELNQPLNAIKMGSEYLLMVTEKKHQLVKRELMSVTSEISSQVTRAAEIIDRLRNFSRKADFAREIIDINNCIRSVHKIVGRQFKLQNIDLVLSLDNSIPPVLAQNNRMEQVIFNLVTNARDAVNQKIETDDLIQQGSIEICSFTEKEHVAITVSDTGTGINEHEKDKIFETFYTTKEMGEGMGLGLSIIQGILRDYNGSMKFESNPGKGSCFKISMPPVGGTAAQ